MVTRGTSPARKDRVNTEEEHVRSALPHVLAATLPIAPANAADAESIVNKPITKHPRTLCQPVSAIALADREVVAASPGDSVPTMRLPVTHLECSDASQSGGGTMIAGFGRYDERSRVEGRSRVQ